MMDERRIPVRAKLTTTGCCVYDRLGTKMLRASPCLLLVGSLSWWIALDQRAHSLQAAAAHQQTGELPNIDKKDARLAELVGRVNGDYDGIVNFLLEKAPSDKELFERASNAAHAFDQLYMQQSFRGLATQDRPLTPFHNPIVYWNVQKPKIIHGSLSSSAFANPIIYAARVDSAKVKRLFCSVILSEGNVEVDDCSRSLIVAGGNVVIGTHMSCSMVLSAGDVTLNSNGGDSGGAIVVSGQKIAVHGNTGSLLLITPKKLEMGRLGALTRSCRVLDGSATPQGLFVFRDLWRDHGVEANLSEGRVTLAKVKPESKFASFLRDGDVIASRQYKTIDSVAQFRRLVGLALDTGQFDFEIERAGKMIHVRGDLKKKSSP